MTAMFRPPNENRETGSMSRAIAETNRRHAIQMAYNKKHGITPQSVKKNIREALGSVYEQDYLTVPAESEELIENIAEAELERLIREFDAKMKKAAKELDFETAAKYRDKIKKFKKLEMA